MVVRVDLVTGLAAAQLGHACIAWTLEHGAPPANLVVLAVAGERELLELAATLADDGASVRLSLFHEPDLGDEATALAVGPESWRALSSLPLFRRGR